METDLRPCLKDVAVSSPNTEVGSSCFTVEEEATDGTDTLDDVL